MFVLVGRDSASVIEAANRLRGEGFQTEAIVLEAVLATIAAVARSGGRIDALLLLGSLIEDFPDFAAVTSETLGVARAVRGLDEKLVFKGGVRARTLPIVIGTPFVPGRGRTEVAGEYLPEFEALPPWTTLAMSSRHWRDSIIEAIQDWRQALVAEL